MSARQCIPVTVTNRGEILDADLLAIDKLSACKEFPFGESARTSRRLGDLSRSQRRFRVFAARPAGCIGCAYTEVARTVQSPNE